MDRISASANLKLVSNETVAKVDGVTPGSDLDTEIDLKWRAQLKKLSVYSPEMLSTFVESHAKQRYLVQGLIRPKSINVLVGDSGLGKTPLGVQLGVCVAAGLPFLDRPTGRGRVLYCDAESDPRTFRDTLEPIWRFVGLTQEPDDFFVWSPNWESVVDPSEHYFSLASNLITRVRCVKPKLVIVDPLRMFWPEAETANDEAAKMIKSLREVSRETGCTWLITHHRRKANQQVAALRLEADPRGWFQEAAGAHALINQSDSRIGVAPPHSGRADLLLGGFMRNTGPFVPLDLARATDAEGEPVGYRLLTGTELLSPDQQVVFARLEQRFRFKDASGVMGGTSDSNATNFLKKCLSLQIVTKEGNDYIKTLPRMERVEPVECPPPVTPATPCPPPLSEPRETSRPVLD